MGYQAIKDGISKMLKAKGFVESDQAFSFDESSDQSTHKKFMIERPAVSLEAEGVEFLATLVRPVSDFKITLGFKLSEKSVQMDYDVAQILIDTLIAYFNNPVNYTAYCIKMKIRSLETRRVDDHLEAEISLEVVDDITLS